MLKWFCLNLTFSPLWLFRKYSFPLTSISTMIATMTVGLICPDHYSLHALNSALHVHCMHIAYQWCKVIAQGPYSVHTKKCNPATPVELNACHRVPSLPCTRRLFNLQMSCKKKELIMILITLFLRSLWWHLTQSTIKIIINKTLNIFSHTSKDKSISAPNFLCTISKDSASMPSWIVPLTSI